MQSYKSMWFSRLAGTLNLYLLLLVWTCTLIFSTTAGRLFASEHTSWMRQALISQVSIVGAVMCNVLPVLLTAAAAFLGSSWLIYLLSAWKGFSLGFFASACIGCFGSAGWLVKTLLLFPQTVCTCIFWWLWIRLRRGGRGVSGCGLACSLVLTFGNAAVFYYGVAPYLRSLLEI